jgi:hypothetical protein
LAQDKDLLRGHTFRSHATSPWLSCAKHEVNSVNCVSATYVAD